MITLGKIPKKLQRFFPAASSTFRHKSVGTLLGSGIRTILVFGTVIGNTSKAMESP